MEQLIFSCLRALRSLFAPGMFKLFMLSLFATIFTLIVFFIAASEAFTFAAHLVQDPAVAEFLPFAGTLGAGIIAWMLFPTIMPIIVNFFDERISTIIERKDYPNSLTLANRAFWPEFFHDASFSAMVIALNIVVLPLYLIPVVNIILFYSLNGYLLGHEFFGMVARRHLTLPEATALRKNNSGIITIAGAALTLLATIPVLNLFAPFWGIAVMVHLYHKLSSNA